MSWLEVSVELTVVLLRTVWAVLVSAYRCLFPAPLKPVRGQVVLVTGAGGGLGSLIAQKLALLGARVVLVDYNQKSNLETLRKLEKMQCEAFAYQCDVASEPQVRELAARVRKEVGDVDILVNNAGVLAGKPILEMPEEQVRKTLEVNTLAHMWTIRQFLPRMLERGEGQIVAIASVAGIVGASFLVDYCASKFGVIGIMLALREELYALGRDEQIILTTICPGTINTGLVQNPRTRFPSLLPILDPDYVAEIVVNSILRDKSLVVIPTLTHAIFKIANLFPPQVLLLLQRFLGYTIDPNV